MTTTDKPTCADLGVEVGDVFAYSWGYEQTNVDLVRVKRVMKYMVEIVPCTSVVMDSVRGSEFVTAGGADLPEDDFRYKRLAGRKMVHRTGGPGGDAGEPILYFDHGCAHRLAFGEVVRQTDAYHGH